MIVLWLVFAFSVVFSTYGQDICPKPCFCNKQLTSVNCEGHKLTSIPDNLPKTVEVLYMSHNKIYYVNLTGNGILPNLREIRLDSSEISGLEQYTFDGRYVPKLATVYLRNNRISVVENSSFSNLSSLSQVYLTNNVIQQIQPAAFIDTPHVTYINLDSNSLSAIPSCGDLQNLEQLYVQTNMITDPKFPSEYLHFFRLTDVGLSNNAIQKLDDTTFKNLRYANVRKLELSRNKIDEISEGAFVWFKHIQSLKLGRNPLTSSDLESAFHGLVGSTLVSLNIDNVTLNGLLPSSTFQLLRNTTIRNLSMKNNKMTSIPQRGFADLKYLLSLDLSASGITSVSDSAFDGVQALDTLLLSDNQISDIPLNLPLSLQKLYLNGNQITVLPKNIFSNLTKLQLLYLGNNKIVKIENNAFYGLTRLKILHLVRNSISNLPGNIFDSFVVLESLELNKNNIQTIPNSPTLFSQMSSLLNLNLAENGLRKCPLELFSVLPSLLHLHLETNNIGELVASDVNGQLFAGLEKLLTLNLADNQLSRLPDALFRDLISLQNLTLKINKISSWGYNLYKKTIDLQRLDLSQNMIALINSTSVQDLVKLQTLDLQQNPFACTCDLRWFRDWMKTTTLKLVNNDTYLCNSPPEWHEKKLISFDRNKINCLLFTVTHMILVGAGGFLVLLFVVGIVYKYRWLIRLRYYRVKRSLRKAITSKKGEYQRIDGEVIRYDAYVSHAEEDDQWVLQNLFPGIDKGSKEDVEYGGEFKLYFEPRDAEIGYPIVDGIIENMEASRVVLIILSKEYIKKERYRFEIIRAFEMLFQKTISDIIIINVDGLTAKDVPKLLRRKMERLDFITWENSEEAKLAFQVQLKESLKRKRKMENVI